ncbi:hypothetical protein TSAR_012266 [Trichomalopsis sarcophagae]|uniref:C2H2-type domain-containing protein n=1 Tax=Trichomalopsis sarcophagae TaxID=543379 RepID=A0A232FP48_9HYME|nr:hypothetical protein TSAR_012266 [Trichomalopsis sarcophagae]
MKKRCSRKLKKSLPLCMFVDTLSPSLIEVGSVAGAGGSNSNEDLRFRCVMCGRGYRSRSSLTRHSRYECGGLGSRYTFTCTLCGKYFCRPDHLKQHILNIHGSGTVLTMPNILNLFYECQRKR